jgi:prepilin-type N-terminal cleavage/methylation domain-containing protein
MDDGFTLVEILVAIVIAGVLAAVVVVGVGTLVDTAATAGCTASADAARAARHSHFATTGAQPTTLAEMVDAGVLDLADGVTLDDAGTSMLGDGWVLTIEPGTPPTFSCSDTAATTTTSTTTTSTTTTAVPNLPVPMTGPTLTGWMNDPANFQLYVYDSAASCPTGGWATVAALDVRMSMTDFVPSAGLVWSRLDDGRGPASGTITSAGPTSWISVAEDGSTPTWLTKQVSGTNTAYSATPGQDRVHLEARATYRCPAAGTELVKTWTATIEPGSLPGGNLNSVMTD